MRNLLSDDVCQLLKQHNYGHFKKTPIRIESSEQDIVVIDERSSKVKQRSNNNGRTRGSRRRPSVRSRSQHSVTSRKKDGNIDEPNLNFNKNRINSKSASTDLTADQKYWQDINNSMTWSLTTEDGKWKKFTPKQRHPLAAWGDKSKLAPKKDRKSSASTSLGEKIAMKSKPKQQKGENAFSFQPRFNASSSTIDDFGFTFDQTEEPDEETSVPVIVVNQPDEDEDLFEEDEDMYRIERPEKRSTFGPSMEEVINELGSVLAAEANPDESSESDWSEHSIASDQYVVSDEYNMYQNMGWTHHGNTKKGRKHPGSAAQVNTAGMVGRKSMDASQFLQAGMVGRKSMNASQLSGMVGRKSMDASQFLQAGMLGRKSMNASQIQQAGMVGRKSMNASQIQQAGMMGRKSMNASQIQQGGMVGRKSMNASQIQQAGMVGRKSMDASQFQRASMVVRKSSGPIKSFMHNISQYFHGEMHTENPKHMNNTGPTQQEPDMEGIAGDLTNALMGALFKDVTLRTGSTINVTKSSIDVHVKNTPPTGRKSMRGDRLSLGTTETTRTPRNSSFGGFVAKNNQKGTEPQLTVIKEEFNRRRSYATSENFTRSITEKTFEDNSRTSRNLGTTNHKHRSNRTLASGDTDVPSAKHSVRTYDDLVNKNPEEDVRYSCPRSGSIDRKIMIKKPVSYPKDPVLEKDIIERQSVSNYCHSLRNGSLAIAVENYLDELYQNRFKSFRPSKI